RWHAVRDALRHRSAPHRTFKSGRRASRMAFPRWSVRNDNRQSTIVPMLCVGMQFVTLCVIDLQPCPVANAAETRFQ
ncbi:hypothetical protein CXB39_23335, partial [Pseudomonas amygdali pv. morsprunorum]